MKLLGVVVLFLVALILLPAQMPALAQTSQTPEATTREFYEWYLHALNQNEDPFEKHQTEMSKFVSRRLMASLNRVRKSPEGFDYDFFIDAQDWDEAWEKNITASKGVIQGARATVRVKLKGASVGSHELRVGLRKEGGVWKIDTVQGRANP